MAVPMLRTKTKLGGGKNALGAGFLTVLAAPLLAGLLAVPDNASAEDVRTSALPPGMERVKEADLPQLLSASDALLYRHILAVQASGKWADADRDIAALSDKTLLGVIQAQRYLSPNYHSTYAQLRDWLAAYADAPEAHSIYSMATKRRPNGAPMPNAPIAAAGVKSYEDKGMGERMGNGDIAPALSTADQARARALIDEIGDAIHNQSEHAVRLIMSAEARHLVDPLKLNELRMAVRQTDTEDRGDDRPRVSGGDASIAHWTSGLSAWRQGHTADALQHFEALAKSGHQSAWVTSAASYWAARAELKSRHPELYTQWMGKAAEHPRTFYGLLARRSLGLDTYFDFEVDAFTDLDAQILTGIPAGRRALALIQIGETQRAEVELRALASRASSNVLQSLVAVADRTNMPSLSLQLAGHIVDSGRHHDRALFPVPHWTPLGGFAVDRALLFGLMRQESEFLPVAHNPSGATGLMQLMPSTARSMASRAGLNLKGEHADKLSDPEVNLALAQEYLLALIDDPHVHGNLLFLAAAYNTGPAAIPKLQAASNGSKDPLLFIESIGNRETRWFIQRVLTNYWIYRMRLGQPTPDLDVLAAGEWPTYTALDQRAEPLSRHAENR